IGRTLPQNSSTVPPFEKNSSNAILRSGFSSIVLYYRVGLDCADSRRGPAGCCLLTPSSTYSTAPMEAPGRVPRSTSVTSRRCPFGSGRAMPSIVSRRVPNLRATQRLYHPFTHPPHPQSHSPAVATIAPYARTAVDRRRGLSQDGYKCLQKSDRVPSSSTARLPDRLRAWWAQRRTSTRCLDTPACLLSQRPAYRVGQDAWQRRGCCQC